MKKYFITSAVACSMMFASCGKDTDTGVDKSNLTPVEAAENWKKDATDGRVASLWDSLPASYQGDVEGIVHNFGANVDAEVYDEAMKTVTSLNGLIKSKKSILLEILKEKEKDASKYQAIEKNYDSVVGLLGAILDSDAKNAAGLKSMNIAEFCGDIQPHTKNLAELAAIADEGMEISKVKAAVIKLISEDGDNAEIEMTIEGKSPEKMKLTKIEDRWIPVEMSADWAKKVAEAKEKIAAIEKMDASQKKLALNIMKAAQDAIKDMEGAKDKDSLMMEAKKGFGGVMGIMMSR